MTQLESLCYNADVIEIQSHLAGREKRVGSATESGAEARLREFLRAQDLNFTRERRLILREVFDIHDHFEAEDVVERLRARGDSVSRASVYRTLPLLVNSGLLREVHSSDKCSHYEHVHGHEHHDHMICMQCGRILEFNDPELEHLEGVICRRARFQPRFHKLEIHGLCEECTEREECVGRDVS